MEKQTIRKYVSYYVSSAKRIKLPDGKRFAFTISDDTDSATLENVSGVYALLAELGFRTTKSCWVVDGDRSQGKFPGDTCDRAEYRQWLLELQAGGFEIGWHGPTWHGLSPRADHRRPGERFAVCSATIPRRLPTIRVRRRECIGPNPAFRASFPACTNC